MGSFSVEWTNEGPLTALDGPMERTLTHARNSIKNLPRGLLVLLEVADLAYLIGAGSSHWLPQADMTYDKLPATSPEPANHHEPQPASRSTVRRL